MEKWCLTVSEEKKRIEVYDSCFARVPERWREKSRKLKEYKARPLCSIVPIQEALKTCKRFTKTTQRHIP